jgi:Xaa-Pro aminopeptidase
MAKPGVRCSHLYGLAVEEAEKYGLAENFMGHGEGKAYFIGHGIGLEIDDLPVLMRTSSTRLREGMILALEPKFIFPGRGLVGMEDDYLVTPCGLERLTLTDQVLMEIE